VLGGLSQSGGSHIRVHCRNRLAVLDAVDVVGCFAHRLGPARRIAASCTRPGQPGDCQADRFVKHGPLDRYAKGSSWVLPDGIVTLILGLMSYMRWPSTA
jgi:hypothetical protein